MTVIEMKENTQEQEARPAPRLNEIPAKDLARLKADGVSKFFTPSPDVAKKLETMFEKAWNMFRDVISDKNGLPYFSCFFVWDSDGSTGDFAPPIDAINTGWGNRAGVGIAKSALDQNDDYLQFLILHEMCHSICGSEHSSDFENYLSYMLEAFNSRYGTNMTNDFAGYEGKTTQRADSKSLTRVYRVDHASFTPEALEALKQMQAVEQTPGHTTQKKEKAKRVRADGMKFAAKRRRKTAATPAAPDARNRMN